MNWWKVQKPKQPALYWDQDEIDSTHEHRKADSSTYLKKYSPREVAVRALGQTALHSSTILTNLGLHQPKRLVALREKAAGYTVYMEAKL